MYPPRPPRPKKTNIVRTRTGCYTCRAQRRKCDEEKPECQRCRRRGLKCEGYATRFSWVDTTESTSERVQKSEAEKWAIIREQNVSDADGNSAIFIEFGSNAPDAPARRSSRTSIGDGSSTGKDASPIPSQPGKSPPLPTSAIKFGPGPPRQDCDDAPADQEAGAGSADENDMAVSHNGIQVVANVHGYDQFGDAVQTAIPSAMPVHTSPTAKYEHMYLSHFTEYLAGNMSPNLRDSSMLFVNSPAGYSIVCAIAASSLTQLQGFTRDTVRGSPKRTFETPDGHFSRAIDYYNRAMRFLVRDSADGTLPSEARLLATLLCAVFEIDSGSVNGYLTHVSGADALVREDHGKILQSSSGRKLLSAWTEVRIRKDYHGMGFRPFDEERTHEPINDCRELARNFYSREADIVHMLNISLKLRERLTLYDCAEPKDRTAFEKMRFMASWYMKNYGCSGGSHCEALLRQRRFLSREEVFAVMRQQRARLDAWYNALPPSEMPSEIRLDDQTEQSESPVEGGEDNMTFKPLIFTSAGAARNYTSYILAQMAISEDLIEFYLPGRNAPPAASADSTSTRPLDPWAHTILRICTTPDPKSYPHSEAFNLGIGHAILLLVNLYPDLRVTSHLLSVVIPRLEKQAAHPSFLFSLAFTKRFITASHQEMLRGRWPLVIRPMNRVDREHVTVLDSGEDRVAAIHGRLMGGGMFSDMIRVPD